MNNVSISKRIKYTPDEEAMWYEFFPANAKNVIYNTLHGYLKFDYEDFEILYWVSGQIQKFVQAYCGDDMSFKAMHMFINYNFTPAEFYRACVEYHKSKKLPGVNYV